MKLGNKLDPHMWREIKGLDTTMEGVLIHSFKPRKEIVTAEDFFDTIIEPTFTKFLRINHPEDIRTLLRKGLNF